MPGLGRRGADRARPALCGQCRRGSATLFESRAQQHRTTTDVAQAPRAATFGAVEALLVNIDAEVPGPWTIRTVPSRSPQRPVGTATVWSTRSRRRALTTGARVMAVRKDDIPEGADLVAILRYPVLQRSASSQKEPNIVPSMITAANATIAPTIATMTMSK